ncbi:hypothetical protein MKW98_021686 [Papaver atlanticum]|uniref:Uncharacterized protein n=1 Tax=Papaver atlanticum TaxID=357466 RepID=A0AAD4S334_9MAGN|nr:hypothetical protein MKW98_021686 [Papaver atlanticum]
MGGAQIDPAFSFRETVLERSSCKEDLVFWPRHQWSKTLTAARMLTKRQSCWPNSVGNSMNNSPSPATNSSDAQLKKIGDKQTCTTGLYGLYRITQLYPIVHYRSYTGSSLNASNAFRTYIEEGFAEMEKNAAAGRTLSSVPISTGHRFQLVNQLPILMEMLSGKKSLGFIKPKDHEQP